ncbi:LAME_0H09736g1_1 [Lachancea meyersii CBS 8951]|uniref:Glutaredoxin-like protein n=1 Tax=Lachancea meyersii CBS 8951 TaxID=1266667 RepID=A0A1G4KFL8_9SACH|nr:LAME_0H09736g1_1 [Lachancea meyersii CBS 8951]
MIRHFHSAARLANCSSIRLTLFSKNNCGLCDKAKEVAILVVNNKQRFNGLQLALVDIDEPQNKEWWNKYCMDVPVLHVENTQKPDTVSKVFHRLDLKQLEQKIEELK